jgi:hypothetical protein
MWYYKNKPIDEIDTTKYKAFVYLITNLVDGRQYIGKKLTESTITRPPLKGQKRKRKIRSESDWRDYWSSSDELKADVERLGEENFKREIIHLCTNKGTASYLEAKEQMINEVLENPDKWYNGIIQCKVHRTHVKLLQE